MSKFSKNTFGYISLLPILTLIQACGTTYNLTPVKDINKDTAKPGIYYYLPRTQVNLEAVLVDSAPIFGKYYNGTEPLNGDPYLRPETDDGEGNGTAFKNFKEVFLYNQEFCNNISDKEGDGWAFVDLQKTSLQDRSKKAYSITDFAISTSAEQDTNHLYRLELDTSFLASVSHTVNVNEKGIFTSSDSVLTDAKSDFVFNLVQSGLNLLTGTVGAAATGSEAQCSAFKNSIKSLAEYKQKLIALKSERAEIVKAPPQNVDASLVTLLLKEKDAEIAKHNATHKSVAASFEKSKASKNYVIVWKLDPTTIDTSADNEVNSAETTAFVLKRADPKVYKLEHMPKEDSKTPKRFTYIPGTAEKLFTRHDVNFSQTSLGIVEAINAVTFDISPSQRASHDRVINNDHVDAGFKYRLPVTSTLNIKHKDKLVSSTDLFVAQFGPILALPKHFSGSSATLHLALNSNTGGFSKATLNTTAIGGSSVSRYVDAYTAYDVSSEAGKEASKTNAEAAAAALAGEELRLLTSENELLQQQVTNRELRSQLGLNDDE